MQREPVPDNDRGHVLEGRIEDPLKRDVGAVDVDVGEHSGPPQVMDHKVATPQITSSESSGTTMSG